MCFTLYEWTNRDLDVLRERLFALSHPENAERENKIVRTGLPVLSVYTEDLRRIAKSIARGNYESFLALKPHDTHEELLLQGLVISEIRRADVQVALLPDYLEQCDSWAHTDSLKFRITKCNQNYWFDCAHLFMQSQNTFERRCGVLILFKLLNEFWIDGVFACIREMRNEQEYYVNMALAWLVCDAFIKQHSATLEFLRGDNLSAWVQNKAISKCRDSRRVSKEDKELLLTLKK